MICCGYEALTILIPSALRQFIVQERHFTTRIAAVDAKEEAQHVLVALEDTTIHTIHATSGETAFPMATGSRIDQAFIYCKQKGHNEADDDSDDDDTAHGRFGQRPEAVKTFFGVRTPTLLQVWQLQNGIINSITRFPLQIEGIYHCEVSFCAHSQLFFQGPYL